MTSCTNCKNNGCCPFWKSEKIDIRTECEATIPLNLCLQMGNTIHIGIDIAKHCEKFQEFSEII